MDDGTVANINAELPGECAAKVTNIALLSVVYAALTHEPQLSDFDRGVNKIALDFYGAGTSVWMLNYPYIASIYT
jgi:hypothetical protein